MVWTAATIVNGLIARAIDGAIAYKGAQSRKDAIEAISNRQQFSQRRRTRVARQNNYPIQRLRSCDGVVEESARASAIPARARPSWSWSR